MEETSCSISSNWEGSLRIKPGLWHMRERERMELEFVDTGPVYTQHPNTSG